MANKHKGSKSKPRQKIHYGKKSPANQVQKPESVSKAVVKPSSETSGREQSVSENKQSVATVRYQQREQVQQPDMNSAITLSFKATDTLFFRESRPMEAAGELQSVFPPPVRTLAGAIRTLIGESAAVNWREYEQDEAHALRKVIGYRDDLGGLKLKGVWLLEGEKERLYPAPLHLLRKEKQLCALELEPQGTWCDLGRNVRLPCLSKLGGQDLAGSKPLENTWLTQAGLEAVLAGGLPDIEMKQLRTESELFVREPRLGIARDNSTRMVVDGMLYQTQHVRPNDELRVEVDVTGLPDSIPQNAMVRLGGEGRMANMMTKQFDHGFPEAPDLSGAYGLMLYLLTPLHSDKPSDDLWNPLPGFVRMDKADGGFTVWRGILQGVELELYAAVTGKALRQGGWDMAKHKPRAVTSLIPAGSVFFCKVTGGDIEVAAKALHNQHIGALTEYGYGHLAVGVWNDSKEKS